MKKVTIHKGFHRPFTFIPACFKNISRVKDNQIITIKVIFTDSCRYTLDGEDQADWNKLDGICFGWRGIHMDSARLVWRYNSGTDVIEIATYCYVNGQREVEKIVTIHINEPVKLTIEREGNKIWFYANDEFMTYNDAFKVGNSLLTFGCGLYFGGNRRAPHDITIKIAEL